MRASDSFFEHTGNCDEEPEATRWPERAQASENEVGIRIELAPDDDQALRDTADAVGLTAASLLRAIVVRLCREGETGGLRFPSSLRARVSVQEEAPRATRVLRRIPLRRTDGRVLRRMATTVACTPSALVARRVAYIAGHIETGPEAAGADDPIDTYRRLLAVLHGESHS
jgi:hypothetical protein